MQGRQGKKHLSQALQTTWGQDLGPAAPNDRQEKVGRERNLRQEAEKEIPIEAENRASASSGGPITSHFQGRNVQMKKGQEKDPDGG